MAKYNCPKCGGPLRPSKKSPGYGLCDNCRKKFRLEEEPISPSKSPASPKKKKARSKGKIILFVIIIFLAVGLISGLINTLTGDNSPKDSKPKDPSDLSSNTTEIEVSSFIECPKFTAEKNTSAMIDQIASVAKQNVENMTDEQADEIIEAIKSADHKFYSGPEEMEKYMWYGYLLEYKYESSDPRSRLGTDLYQAIKYVYRDAESVTDSATHENLLQIDKDLEEIQ